VLTSQEKATADRDGAQDREEARSAHLPRYKPGWRPEVVGRSTLRCRTRSPYGRDRRVGRRDNRRTCSRFGGMEALDAPYMENHFRREDQEARGAVRVFLSEMLTRRDAALSGRDRARRSLAMSFRSHELRRKFGSQGPRPRIRALRSRSSSLRDWWRIAVRELPTGARAGVIRGILASQYRGRPNCTSSVRTQYFL